MANVLQHGSDFDLVNILEQQQEIRTTGRLALVAPAPASLYLYRGCVYSAKVEGWDPDIIARLQLAGRLSAEQAAHYRAEAPDDHAQQARLVVLDGTVPVEELNTIYLEYLLSAVEALRPYTPSGIVDATVTDIRCAIPVEVGPLRETLRVRAHRGESTWSAVGRSDRSSDLQRQRRRHHPRTRHADRPRCARAPRPPHVGRRDRRPHRPVPR